MARTGIKVQYMLVTGKPEIQWITDPDADLDTLVANVSRAVQDGSTIQVAPVYAGTVRLINGQHVVSVAFEVLSDE